jgi:hypothetical protein
VNDKREHPRYAIELDTIIVTDDGELPGRSRDLSKGGFCMLAPSPMLVGTACKVRIALVFSETEFSEHLTLPATIMWCTRTQGVHQIGVKFAPLDPSSRGYLDMFMKFLEGGEEEADEEKPESEFDGE